MKKGCFIILLISLLEQSTGLRACQKTPVDNNNSRNIMTMTRDWWYGIKNQERKEKRENRRQHLFTVNKKTLERHKNKKKIQKQNEPQRCDEKYLNKGHYIIGFIHHKKAEKCRKDITANKEELCNVQNRIKKLYQQTKRIVAKTPSHIRHNALLASRHAETKIHKKEADYACARIHGTEPHPQIKKLEQRASDLRFKIKMDARELRKMRGVASGHYYKANFTKYLQKVTAQQLENNIISGKTWRRTRKNLNESQDQITRKKEVEMLRKEQEQKRRDIRMRDREIRNTDRKKRKSCKECAAPIMLVVQKNKEQS